MRRYVVVAPWAIAAVLWSLAVTPAFAASTTRQVAIAGVDAGDCAAPSPPLSDDHLRALASRRRRHDPRWSAGSTSNKFVSRPRRDHHRGLRPIGHHRHRNPVHRQFHVPGLRHGRDATRPGGRRLSRGCCRTHRTWTRHRRRRPVSRDDGRRCKPGWRLGHGAGQRLSQSYRGSRPLSRERGHCWKHVPHAGLWNLRSISPTRKSTTIGSRISRTSESTLSTTGSADLKDNWWGCNDGPNGPGCATLVPQAFGLDGWLQLKPIGAPTTVGPGKTVEINFGLVGSTSRDLATDFPAAAIAFSTTAGSVDPVTATIIDGIATTTFTAPDEAGIYTVTALLDGGTASVTFNGPVATSPPPTAPPTSTIASEVRKRPRRVGSAGGDRLSVPRCMAYPEEPRAATRLNDALCRLTFPPGVSRPPLRLRPRSAARWRRSSGAPGRDPSRSAARGRP